MNFVDYLTSLAAEGETVLFVRQKPRKGGDGQLQYHADGALKATMTAPASVAFETSSLASLR